MTTFDGNPTVAQLIKVLEELNPEFTVEAFHEETGYYLGFSGIKPDPMEKGNYIFTAIY